LGGAIKWVCGFLIKRRRENQTEREETEEEEEGARRGRQENWIMWLSGV